MKVTTNTHRDSRTEQAKALTRKSNIKHTYTHQKISATQCYKKAGVEVIRASERGSINPVLHMTV